MNWCLGSHILWSFPWIWGTNWKSGKRKIFNFVRETLEWTKIKKRFVMLSEPLTLDTPVHSFQPGDPIHIQIWKPEPLQEQQDLIWFWWLQDRLWRWKELSPGYIAPEFRVDNGKHWTLAAEDICKTISEMYRLIFMGIILSLGGVVEENLILTWIQGFGKMHNLSSITACFPFPSSAGKLIPGQLSLWICQGWFNMIIWQYKPEWP